ncbi:serine/threonine-protein kinase RsbW [Paenibacillus endophyticus]|uniref:Serine/threonine-protein kinase RsbW n=1 Tax=Paenibacillus endophyticus TaxID=1294268 RepID=A0A7W5G8V1_9BACL|nr:ATP-binding protein [Paenibacillus endophyticus]MBB3151001.1 serine/threonine-protein kinase RsbW [Paenibacillus endophyticus]
MNAIRLQIPAHADYIDMVRICLFGIASKMNYAYEEMEDMKVAVSEACNNAVIHGEFRETSNVIDISFEPKDSGLTIKVKNNGVSTFVGEALEKASPLPDVDVSGLRVGGLGIYLMQALMDEVEVNASESGTEVVLTKYLDAAAEH